MPENENIVHEYPENPKTKRKTRAGKLFTENDKDIVVFGGEKKIQNEKVQQEIAKTQSSEASFYISRELWRSSLEVISSMMPISLMDSNSGLIVTDWGTLNQNQNRRYKLNVLVKGKDVSEDSLVVSVFEQKLHLEKWENTNTDGSLKKDITSKILRRAKELQRVQ